jgi:hypothetical protein
LRIESTINRGEREMASSQDAMRAEWEALNKATAEQHGAVEADTQPITENPVEPQEIQEVEEAPIEKPAPPPQTRAAVNDGENFRRLKEKNQELERKLQEMEAYLKKDEKQETPEEEYDLKDDDITEGKHYKALKKQVRGLNEAILKERQERDKIAAEARLRAEYPDIFKVVTKENMEELARKKPEVARAILTSTDQYAQYATAYDLIKTYGIGDQDPYAEDKARAQRNLAKPKSAATVFPRQGESPLAEADRFSRGMTPELQQQLLKEMEESISNR